MGPLFSAVVKKLKGLIENSRLPIRVEESELGLVIGGFFIDFPKEPSTLRDQYSSEVATVNYQLSDAPPTISAMLDHHTIFSYKVDGTASKVAWSIFGDVEKMFIQGISASVALTSQI